MEAASGLGRTLRATLCEIERGVFYASYHQGPDTEELPSYQVGRSAEEAKERIERCAAALGFVTVLWRESIVIPSFGAQAAKRDKSTQYVGRHGG